MFSTAFLRLSTMLRSSRSLSRAIRVHMEKAIQNHTQLSEVVIPALGIARAAGRSDEVRKRFREAVSLVEQGGELVLLQNERQTEAIELKVEDSVDHLPRLLARLKRAIMSSSLEQSEKNKLCAQANKLLSELKQMYDQMISDIKSSYASAFAETRAAAGGDEHRLLAERNFAAHTILLAEAMKHVYHLRSDAKDIKGDTSNFKEIEALLESELVKMSRRHEAVPKLLARIEDDEKKLSAYVAQLLDHIRTNFHRFTLIMQVFTTYYFVFRKDERELGLYLEEIRKEGFSAQEYEKLHALLSKDDATADALAGDVANVLIRMRHVPQEGEDEAAKAA